MAKHFFAASIIKKVGPYHLTNAGKEFIWKVKVDNLRLAFSSSYLMIRSQVPAPNYVFKML